MLNDVMLNVIMLNVVILSVIMLSVVAPYTPSVFNDASLMATHYIKLVFMYFLTLKKLKIYDNVQ